MKPIVAASACLAITTAWAVDQVPLNVKPGNWETTTTLVTNGKPPLPPELVAKLSPQQRAELEASRAKQPSTSKNTTTSRQCLSQADLAKPLSFSNNSDCKSTLIASSATKMEAHLTCSAMGVTMTGTLKVEALTPESVKFVYDLKTASGTETMTVNGTSTGKWLGADCPH